MAAFAPNATTGVATQTFFEGWFLQATTTPIAVTCPTTETWQTSGTYGACCDTNPCRFITDCFNSVLTYDDGNTVSCDDDFSCISVTVFETPGPTPGAINKQINCAVNWDANTLYRQIPATTTAPSSTHTHTHTHTSSAPTTSSTSSHHSGGGHASTGVIAGSVVGAVGGFAVAGAGILWYLRRRHQKKQAAASSRLSTVSSPPQSWWGQGQQPHTYQSVDQAGYYAPTSGFDQPTAYDPHKAYDAQSGYSVSQTMASPQAESVELPSLPLEPTELPGSPAPTASGGGWR